MSTWNLSSAQTAHSEGRIQEWIEAYLQVPEWVNWGLLQRVQKYSVEWPAPQLIQLGQLWSPAGPGGTYMFPKDPVEWERDVSAIAARSPSPEDLPPMIAWINPDGIYNLADGNHRKDALIRMGYSEGWVLLHQQPLLSQEEIRKRLGN